MQYYRLYHTNNEKVVGKYEQTKECLYNFNVNEYFFIENIKWHLKKIEFVPLIPTIILWKKTKVTDIISASFKGLHNGFVISNRLKIIIEKSKYTDVQFFPINVLQNNTSIGSYWFMRYYNTSLENIDFNNSTVWENEHTFHKVAEHKVSSTEYFLSLNKSLVYPRSLHILEVVLQQNLSNDLFALNYIDGGIGCFVSEKLRKNIDNAGCTGIVFKDINENYP